MDLEKQFLNEHTATCIYPIVDKETGKRKRLCGAMTFKEGGRHQPFCKEHLDEVRKILEFRKGIKKKKRSFRVHG